MKRKGIRALHVVQAVLEGASYGDLAPQMSISESYVGQLFRYGARLLWKDLYEESPDGNEARFWREANKNMTVGQMREDADFWLPRLETLLLNEE